MDKTLCVQCGGKATEGICWTCGAPGAGCTCPPLDDPPAAGDRNGRRAPVRPAFEVIDLEPAAETIEPPELIAGELLYRGAVHTLTGPPDCGKTTLACWWMLQEIRAGGRVLFLDEEGGRQVVAEKFQALGAAPGERIAYAPFPGRTWANADLYMLAAITAEWKPTMITWDSSAAFLARAGLDENAAADVTGFYSRVLAPCARRDGAAVVAIDHDVKNGEPSRYARGSGAKLAATDVAYKVEPVTPFSKTSDGKSKLTVSKDRRGWLHRSHEVTFSAGTLLGVEIQERAAGEFRPTVLMGRICDALTKAGELTFRDLKARVRGKEDHLREALAILIDEGNVKVRNGPRGSHLHELAAPFNE
jgi:hypothetical protein